MPWKPLRRRIRLALSLLALALAATACGSGGASSGGDTITLGLPVQATTLAPVYLADDLNLWKQHGLTVKAVTFKGDAELAKAVLSGDVDVAVGSLTGPLTAEEAGQDVKVIYGGFDMTAFSWYAVPEIHTVAQGKGKNWGVTTIGSSTDLLTRFAAAKAGLDPNKDIKVVQGGASAARLAAMKAGQLQANIFTEPQTVYAQKAGYNKILDLKDLVDSYPMHVTWSKPGFVDDNPDRAKKFVDTLAQAMKMTKDQPDDAVKSIAKNLKISTADAKASMAEWIDQLYPDGRMPSAKAMDDFWQMGLQGKVFAKRLPDSQWLDTRFLPKTS
ncbi:ABC transporter substrate-binding protein [Amycolatopsis sp. FDAARGOS 1241]|uniref:ABC transporter substrate-binding protein n=1 Tax=Amycolatopsis sp. FDAARGOS 1241 TaxID=2778070 RepID=UPI0019500AF6|nr:ABC transporter substrate-binding protein [Amycolatopsis sp. FDAARGOS 1241]QRP43657.1 ABC transporter substrate-binding protein [Amycolatopsis sp. FDAARGOS 1241]